MSLIDDVGIESLPACDTTASGGILFILRSADDITRSSTSIAILARPNASSTNASLRFLAAA